MKLPRSSEAWKHYPKPVQATETIKQGVCRFYAYRILKGKDVLSRPIYYVQLITRFRTIDDFADRNSTTFATEEEARRHVDFVKQQARKHYKKLKERSEN